MQLGIWLAFVGAVLTLMSTPGPSQLLILSNSIKNGYRRSLLTGIGDLTANLIQMIIASLGLVSIIKDSHQFFMIVKWVGVLYLVYLGLKTIYSNSTLDLKKDGKSQSLTTLYWQGFITSAANPKAVIFFAALFPQFINSAEPLIRQFAILSITYIIIDGIFLCCYAGFANWINNRLESRMSNLIGKISGAFLIIAAILLGLKDIQPD